MKFSTLLFAYPFRSKEVRAIFEHMTLAEVRAIRRFTIRQSAVWGLITAPVIAIYLQAHARLFPGEGSFWQHLLTSLIIASLIGVLAGNQARKVARRMLCDTEFAREKGITPETLKLYSWEE
ncbi:MAG: hypothetical protein K9N36_09980 [Candidatus Marinimicrobia bacterium]|nr:hypothetical protein [Candidatus Neomarinimicrobiota bacterium]